MAQRIATEFVKANLALSERELARMQAWLAKHGATCRLNEPDAASRVLELRLDGRETLTLHFRRQADRFVSEGSYLLHTLPMADVMRKAVLMFKGDAIVNRIYADFTMVYIYERGTVVKIIESSGWVRRVIYDYHNLAGRLERLYARDRIEREIAVARSEINALLDRRLKARDAGEVAAIDRELSAWRHRLFVLEA